MSARNHPETLPARIIVLDRTNLQECFSPRRRFLLLSIRRPGSRFATGQSNLEAISRCNVILHEWDEDNPPYPLPQFILQSRQAIKIATWLKRFKPVLEAGKVDLVIQSEMASSQLSAIVQFAEAWMQLPIENPFSAQPHFHTRVLLDMARAATSLRQDGDPTVTIAPSEAVSKRIDALGKLFRNQNVDFVVSTTIRPVRIGDLETARSVADGILKSVIPEANNDCAVGEVIDFIAGVLAIRGTQICRPEDSAAMEIDPSETTQALLLLEPTMKSVTELYSVFPGSIHWFTPRVKSIDSIALKSVLLSRGAWLLETANGDHRLLSTIRRRDAMSEILHREIRGAT